MRTLPQIYSQRDDRWASQRLGTVDGTTIGQYGCYITSYAMLACYYNHTVNPAQLDDLFTNNGWYVNGNLLTDDGLHKAYPDINYVQSYSYPNNPADLNLLKNLLSDPTVSVCLELDFDHDPNDGIQTHFVIALDCDGTNVTIADPWYGTENNFTDHYGNNPAQTILKFVVYKGTLPQPTPQPSDLQQQLDQARKDRDENWSDFSQVCTALNVQANPTDKAGSVTSALAAIKSFSDQLAQSQKAVNERDESISQLKVQIEQVNASSAGIADLYAKKCKEDETTSALGRQALSNLKEVTSDMESAAEALGTKYPDIKNVLTAIDAKDTAIKVAEAKNQETVKQAQNFFQMLINIFWKKKS